MVKVRFTGKQSRYFTVEICAENEKEARKAYENMGTDDMDEVGELEWEDVDDEVVCHECDSDEC